ncbi:MAG: hypothetical protein CMJ22_03465 [Phycisphaerae bacterium]|nr:hypothetical protein [Phycisphaerae bacterium]HAC09487.1 hypothetical protein [Phycisphaerales bacterium]
MDDGGYRAFMARVLRILAFPLVVTVALGSFTTTLRTAVAQDAKAKQPARRVPVDLPRPGVPRQVESIRARLLDDDQAARLALGVDPEQLRIAAVPKHVRVVVDRLAADGFDERERASADLREMSITNDVLMAVLEQDGLDEEQRNRLLRVLRWRVLYRPRGAVGIRMEPSGTAISVRGVLVTEVITGLPAEKVLRVGDVILRIDGQRITTSADLIGRVQRLQPGDPIRMGVIRPVPADTPDGPGILRFEGDRVFEEVDVEFPLGSYDKLGNDPSASAMGNPETMRRRGRVEAIWARWGSSPRSVGIPKALDEDVRDGPPAKSPSQP